MKNIFFALLMVLLLPLTSCNKEKNAHQSEETIDTVVADAPIIVGDTLRSGLPAPFNTLDFDRVVAYDYGDSYDGVLIINGKGKPDKSVITERELTAGETADFLAVLGNPETYGNGVSDCFAPHLGLVLYRGYNVVFHASICLDCNYLKSSMAIPAMVRPHKDIVTGKERFGEGFSESGQQKLEALCTGFRFSHCNGHP